MLSHEDHVLLLVVMADSAASPAADKAMANDMLFQSQRHELLPSVDSSSRLLNM